MKQEPVPVVLGGSGTRFGADKPKQYCDMKGKPVIEYVLDACKLSYNTIDAYKQCLSNDKDM